MFYVLAVCAISYCFSGGFGTLLGPLNNATEGELWPKAFQEKKGLIAYHVDPTKINYKVTGKDCRIIYQAIKRCKDYVEILADLKNRYGGHDEETIQPETLDELQINLSQPCEDYPNSTMEESYNLTVSVTSELSSSSVWGIIRGIEAFSQLFYLTSDFKKILINGTVIMDKPQYPHRGLMLDTSRHYISVPNILKHLDALAMNRMNVFHWHISDNESFPYQSIKLPELSGKAAFHSSLVYTKSDMEMIRDYARDRGIRVLMEIDSPGENFGDIDVRAVSKGHSKGSGASHPQVLTECNASRFSNPLNVIRFKTYKILKAVLREIQDIFPDNQFHLGGYEVYTDCWKNNSEIAAFMKKHKISTKGVNFILFKRILSMLRKGTVPVIWEDMGQILRRLSNKTIVECWHKWTIDCSVNVVKAGFSAITANYYYLDQLDKTFSYFYSMDPRSEARKKGLTNDTLLHNIVGGESCMWTANVDDTNVFSWSWPRTSALAEVLWSHTQGAAPDEHTHRRAEEQVCRMRRRGLPASPLAGPGFCVL